MKTGLQLSVAALALAGVSLFASVPANADIYGPRGGIGFSYETGGYCDSAGCPDDFWDYPIAYCPVYFDGEWYRGPFYYRYWQGDYYYWIRGDWRMDEWSGDRPDDACVGRFGPPQDYDFYVDNGFIWLDTWRLRFFHHHHHHDHDHDGDHDHDHDHDHHGDHGHGSWDHAGDHGVVWDHGGDHSPQSGGSTGGTQGGASGAPTPLGGAGGGGSNSDRGFRDRLRGDESGPHHHEGGPPAANSDSPAGGGSGGHHFEGGARNALPQVSSPPPPAPPPPPPPPPPPSNGESHHDGGFRGDFGHHTQKP